MSLTTLPWYGWVLLALSTNGMLHEFVKAAHLVRTGSQGSVSFLFPICGLMTVLCMLVNS